MGEFLADRSALDPHIAPELDRSALLVIDTQVDFVDGGATPIPGTSAVVPAVAGLLAAFRAVRRPVGPVVRLYDGDDVDDPAVGGDAEPHAVGAVERHQPHRTAPVDGAAGAGCRGAEVVVVCITSRIMWGARRRRQALPEPLCTAESATPHH